MLALGIVLAAASAAAAEDAYLRGPYVVDASSTAVRVCWRDDEDRCGEWKNLQPGEEFEYAIDDGKRRWTARTLPPAGAPLRFAAFGDVGTGGSRQKKVAARLAAYDPQFVVITGDVVYPKGHDDDYDDSYFKPYRDIISRIPFFPSPGNHDYGNYRGRKKSRRRLRGHYEKIHRRPRYYAFTVGDARFFSLDTNQEGFAVAGAASIAEGSAQREWLERELARSNETWKIAFFHAPVYSSGKHGVKKAVRDSLEPLFERYGVDLALQGHDHNYERTSKIKRTVYVVTGTGGARLRGLRRKSRGAWSEFALIEHGFLGIEIKGSSLKMEFYDEDGEVRDFAELTKAPRTAPRRPGSRSR
jgi:hypothetical protein